MTIFMYVSDYRNVFWLIPKFLYFVYNFPMFVAVCEDDEIQREYLIRCIKEYDETINVISYGGSDALWWDIQDGKEFDLLFLDIEMPHMNGMELAHHLLDSNRNIPLCFVTGIKDYVFEGYEVEACGYLLKPYEKDQVFRILKKVQERHPETEKYIMIEQQSETVRISVNEIVALEARAHDTLIYMKDGRELLVHKSFQAMMEDTDLFQVHRSYAVNMRNIESVTKNDCVDKKGKTYPVSRGRKDAAMQQFIRINRGAL